jgi:hypothetical protein
VIGVAPLWVNVVSCDFPKKAYFIQGRAQPVFYRPSGHSGAWILVRCWQCLGCRLWVRADWQTRCMLEARMHESNLFLTCTYDDEHLPKDLDVSLREAQLFVKRMRKRFGADLTFMQLGEYGDQTARPHYHSTWFGLSVEDGQLFSAKRGNRLYRSSSLEEVWGLGNVLVAPATAQTMAYVAGHQLKDLVNVRERSRSGYELLDVSTGELRKRRVPFRTQSNRPAIGRRWFDKYWRDVFVANQGTVILNGERRSAPRYFWRLLEKQQPELFAKLWAERVLFAESDQFRAENTAERLAVRAKVRSAKIAFRRPAGEVVEAVPWIVGVEGLPF